MNQRKSIARIGSSVFLLTGFLAASSIGRAADFPDSEHVSKLLSEAKVMAFQVKEDAVTMESFTRMNVSVENQAVAINKIKEEVNTLGRQVDKLKAARGEASPWQKTAIDRIQPFLDELGGYTAAVIDHLNGTPRHNIAEYQDYLEADHYLSHTASLASPGAGDVLWPNPLRAGDTLKIRVTILEARLSRSKPDRGIVRSRVEVINQKDELVLSMTAVSILRRRERI